MLNKPVNIPIPFKDTVARKAFIVHGHDDSIKLEVANLLHQLKIEPVILHEQTNAGMTIVEKFEKYSKVPYALVILTPDDEGRKKGETRLHFRARQNVVFELGYFYGALGRKNVCCLKKGEIEQPSDHQGIVYVSYDDGLWKRNLAREMESVFEVNLATVR